MLSLLRKLWEDESGQALVEYGMVVAMALVAAAAVYAAFQPQIVTFFQTIAAKLQIPTG